MCLKCKGNQNRVMKPSDLLAGKIALVMTDVKVEVELEIKSVKERTHSEEIEESGPHNDW